MATDQTYLDAAADWALRTADPRFDAWEAFTAWLEEDPAHAAAYDRIVAAVEDVAQAGLPEPIVPHSEQPARAAPRPRWLGGAVAASLALLAVMGVTQLRGGAENYATAPGETRRVALDDGSAITLAGDTRLAVLGDRRARLEQGQALFEIRHDAEQPFELAVGEDRLVDAGTVFDVRRALGTTTLAVAEGAVIYNPAQQNLRLSPGEQAVRRDGDARIARSALPAAMIGEWREGRLTFRDAPLADVAADLSRATGIAFAVAPGAAARRVSGSVLTGPLQTDPASLGALLGVSVTRSGAGWTIAP